MSSRPRVLLLWPGCEGPASGNFGVPQLVLMATYARSVTGAEIVIRDLALERLAFAPVDLPRLLGGEGDGAWDIIAFSVYSSFDYLKCLALADIARELAPEAVICAGGYHASARPMEIIDEGSPFDVCVVGEGEHALVEIIESVKGGAPLRETILPSHPVLDLDALPPSDWSFLDRYRHVARRYASQAQVYLSRGCPFDCAFCMERAKREVSWRSPSVERALLEITSLHDYLDLSTWTLYFADALFGMKKSWRREFLEGLARADVPVEKNWLLIRVDLVEDEDLRLFADANCGLGFGLESGDPTLLATIRKAGRLDTYLERMTELAAWARERDVPWGANIIAGHPGETPDTMRRSARYMEELFLQPKGVTGFLSVDPFRLYPGSPIDAERGDWERRFGAVFHRPSWWQDGDQEFLAEWIDPSAELDWRERTRLTHELFSPVLRKMEEHFVYRGAARDYFVRAIRDQVRFTQAPTRLHYLDRYYAWQGYLGGGERARDERERDSGLAELARGERARARAAVAESARLEEGDPILGSIETVPRERFVPLDQTRASTRDLAIPLDSSRDATVSAMHAYARTFALAGIDEGMTVLDLGGGTGYGATVLSELVGPTGHVVSVELDPRHSRMAARLVPENVHCVCGDAMDPTNWGEEDFDAVVVGFALPEIPPAWLSRVRPGARLVAPLVAPLVDGDRQILTRLTIGGAIEQFEDVVYVPMRKAVPGEESAPEAAVPRRLPVV